MFLVNSRHPLVCAPAPELPPKRASFSRTYGGILPSSFNAVLSSASVCSTSPPVSVSGTVYSRGCFPERLRCTRNPLSGYNFRHSSHPGRPRTVNLVPIDYGFRPRLRGRLTLRGLTLRRNPWTSGESVSHTLYRYSCQHSRFRYLQDPSRVPLHWHTERSATAGPEGPTRSFGTYLEPRYIFGAGQLN